MHPWPAAFVSQPSQVPALSMSHARFRPSRRIGSAVRTLSPGKPGAVQQDVAPTIARRQQAARSRCICFGDDTVWRNGPGLTSHAQFTHAPIYTFGHTHTHSYTQTDTHQTRTPAGACAHSHMQTRKRPCARTHTHRPTRRIASAVRALSPSTPDSRRVLLVFQAALGLFSYCSDA